MGYWFWRDQFWGWIHLISCQLHQSLKGSDDLCEWLTIAYCSSKDWAQLSTCFELRFYVSNKKKQRFPTYSSWFDSYQPRGFKLGIVDSFHECTDRCALFGGALNSNPETAAFPNSIWFLILAARLFTSILFNQYLIVCIRIVYYFTQEVGANLDCQLRMWSTVGK